MNRIRAFLAANFSVAVTRKIADEVERRRKAMTGVAWVVPANLHLTLRFLGSIDEVLVDGISAKLKRLAARNPPFEARARGLGSFPGAEQPSVLWVGVDGGEPLAKLQKEIEAAMVELGLVKEERPFHPHITVGRVKEPRPLPEWSAEAEFGISTIGEVVVYESRAIKSGVEYVARARVALGLSAS